MFFIFFSLLLFLAVFWGLGWLSLSALGITSSRNPFLSIFLGLFCVSFLGMGISFFIPLSLYVQLGFFGLGIAWTVYKFRLFQKYSFKLSFLVFLFIFLLSVSYLMGYEIYPYNTDTDTYHANAVTWLKQYGTVLGLANLFERFGVNTSWHVLAAVIDHGLWEARSVWFMPTLAYGASALYFSWDFFHAKKLWAKAFSLLILCWTYCNVLTWGFPSLHYDFVALLYNAVLVFESLYLVFDEDESSEKLKKCSLLLILGCASFIIKPMGVVSLLFIGLLTLFFMYQAQKLTIRQVIIMAFFPVLILGAWLTRNIMLSGWPLFPSPIWALDFDWTASLESVKHTYEDVLFWARKPGPDYLEVGKHGFSFWFYPWLKNAFFSIRFWFVGTFPFVFGLVGWGFIFYRGFSKEKLFFFLWTLGSLVYWFALAPDIRFGDGFFIVFMCAPWAFYLDFYPKSIQKHFFIKVGFVSLLAFMFVAAGALYTGKRGPVNLWTIGEYGSGAVVLESVSPTQPELKIWRPVKLTECLKSSLPKICPANSKFYDELPACGNSLIPCSSYYDSKLRFRRIQKQSMNYGFTINNK